MGAAELQFSSDDKRKLYEKIAKFEILGVSDDETCQAIGIKLTDLYQIRDDSRYKIIYGEELEAKLEERETFNRGWDAVEDKALERVIHKLNYGGDPEFALKAAVLANKARRRPATTKTIDATGTTPRAAINLQQNFVLQIRDNGINPTAVEQLPKKQQDFMGVEKVEQVLIAPQNKDEEIELPFIPDMVTAE